MGGTGELPGAVKADAHLLGPGTGRLTRPSLEQPHFIGKLLGENLAPLGPSPAASAEAVGLNQGQLCLTYHRSLELLYLLTGPSRFTEPD